MRTRKAVEIPIRYAIDAGDEGRVSAHHAGNVGSRTGKRVRLEGDDNIILLPSLRGRANAARVNDDGFTAGMHGDTIGLHGGQMWATRDESDVCPGLGEFYAHHAANGACAEDGYFHGRNSSDTQSIVGRLCKTPPPHKISFSHSHQAWRPSRCASVCQWPLLEFQPGKRSCAAL